MCVFMPLIWPLVHRHAHVSSLVPQLSIFVATNCCCTIYCSKMFSSVFVFVCRNMLLVLLGTAVAPSRPREEGGTYWGYTTRLASSLKEVFSGCPFEVRYQTLAPYLFSPYCLTKTRMCPPCLLNGVLTSTREVTITNWERQNAVQFQSTTKNSSCQPSDISLLSSGE